MSVDVSVVIPTYNTGPKLDDLLDSLQAQTLANDRYEVVVVDDGSTDDTWERLQRRQQTMSNLVIDRIPNSGWPGKPRNVGTDLARGRWVFYSDHDDEFFLGALAAMVEYGDKAQADVVIGKEVRSGGLSIGPELFHADLERARLFEDDVLALITPHKLFRTEFLRDKGIRFLEGKRRLEDHTLLADVYTKTDRIAVLSSVPCYRWMIYDDGSNNSSALGDLDVYFSSLDDVFEVIERADIPQETKDELTRFWYATRMLKRFYGYWFEDWDDDYRADAIRVIGDLAAKRVPVALDAGLPPLLRRRSDLLRAGRVDEIVSLAYVDHRVRLTTDEPTLTWSEQGLTIAFKGQLVDRDDVPLRLDSVDGGLFWRNDPEHAYDLMPLLSEATVDLFVRQHNVGTEWYVLQPAPMSLRPSEDGTLVTVEASYTIDPRTLVFGRRLDDGPWSIYVHAQAFGYSSRLRLRGDTRAAAVLDGLAVYVSPNEKGQVILSVGATPRFLKATVGEATITGSRVTAELKAVPVYGAPPRYTLRAGGEVLETTVRADRLEAELPNGAESVDIGYDGRGWRPLVEAPKKGLLARLRGR